MLTSLIMSLVIQLPMSGIINEQPVGLTPPAVVVQEKIVVKKIYVMIDKFGVEHENESREAAIKSVSEANKKPFRMKDGLGQEWTHQDKAVLEQFISTRNSLLGCAQPAG